MLNFVAIRKGISTTPGTSEDHHGGGVVRQHSSCKKLCSMRLVVTDAVIIIEK